MKITVGHQPFADQISNIATISLFVSHISGQIKGYEYIRGCLGLTPFNVIVANMYTII